MYEWNEIHFLIHGVMTKFNKRSDCSEQTDIDIGTNTKTINAEAIKYWHR